MQAIWLIQELNRDEARAHPNKNIITRALGVNEIAQRIFEVELSRGDIVLMCSRRTDEYVGRRKYRAYYQENVNDPKDCS